MGSTDIYASRNRLKKQKTIKISKKKRVLHAACVSLVAWFENKNLDDNLETKLK